jgi:hypothetical protein
MKKTQLLLPALILCAAGPLVACSGDKANIGNTSAIGAQLSDYAATWDGYTEAYSFRPDGSDRVRLIIDASGHGTLQVGDAALLPAATDPNVGYPPGATLKGPSSVNTTGLTEGFLYPIYATQVQADRIQLGVNPGDLYAGWCALQTPIPFYETTITGVVADGGTVVPTNDGGTPITVSGVVDGGVVSTFYGCTPNVPTMQDGTGSSCALQNPDGTWTPIDCGKLNLCQLSLACMCSASGCTSYSIASGTPVGNYPIELDGALDSTGTQLTGTLNVGTRVTVHLVKQ